MVHDRTNSALCSPIHRCHKGSQRLLARAGLCGARVFEPELIEPHNPDIEALDRRGLKRQQTSMAAKGDRMTYAVGYEVLLGATDRRGTRPRH